MSAELVLLSFSGAMLLMKVSLVLHTSSCKQQTTKQNHHVIDQRDTEVESICRYIMKMLRKLLYLTLLKRVEVG
jgi:hypothetical protein